MSVSYMRHMRNLDRADAMDAAALDLALLLKAGDDVRIYYNRKITALDVDERADANGCSRDEACDQLAAQHVEAWAHYERTNS